MWCCDVMGLFNSSVSASTCHAKSGICDWGRNIAQCIQFWVRCFAIKSSFSDFTMSKLHKVPSFSDNADTHLTQSQQSDTLKKGRNLRAWEKDLTFETTEEALLFLKNENTWRKETTNNSISGTRVIYCCNKTRQRQGSSCTAALQLLYHCDSVKVII